MKINFLLLGFCVAMAMAQGGDDGDRQGRSTANRESRTREHILKVAQRVADDMIKYFAEDFNDGDEEKVQEFKDLARRIHNDEQNQKKLEGGKATMKIIKRKSDDK